MSNFYSKLKSEFNFPRGIVSSDNDRLNNFLKKYIPFNTLLFKSGEKADSWTVPNAWEVNSAELKIDSKKIDLSGIPLLVPFGTESFSIKDKFGNIKEIIQTIPNKPYTTPYRTNYYAPSKKFCLPFYLLENLDENQIFEVDVKTNSYPSSMQINEVLLKGESEQEVLFTTYNCHPGLGNDNFSGILSFYNLYERILNLENRHFSYRFAIFPETIGAIFYIKYLKKNQFINNIISHKVLTCLGGNQANYSFKDSKFRSIYSESFKNKLSKLIPELKVLEYSPDGSDERQFSSPNVGIPSFNLCRNRYYEYEEYHTSDDNLEFMNETKVIESCDYIFETIKFLDQKLRLPKSISLYGEPHFNYFNLELNSGGSYHPNNQDKLVLKKKCIMEILSASDGSKTEEELINSLSVKLQIDHESIRKYLVILIKKGIVRL